jgi:SIR2-like domain
VFVPVKPTRGRPNGPVPPKILVDAFRDNRGAVFVGGGASIAAGVPGWDDLVIACAKELEDFPIPKKPLSSDDLLKIPQYYVNASNGSMRPLGALLIREFSAGIAKFRASRPKPVHERPVHHYLAKLPVRSFYTTNVDALLEEELRSQHIDPKVIFDENVARQAADRAPCEVRKLHGSLEDRESLVLTRSAFAAVRENRPVLFNALAQDLQANVFLFVGYSLRDPDFTAIYNTVFQLMKGEHQNHFIAFVEDPGRYELEDLRQRGLNPIPLWQYPGNNATEKTCAFLNALVRETSDLQHMKSYYRGIDIGENVPLVIPFRIRPADYLAYHPSADIHAAHVLATHLERLGVRYHFVGDVNAMKDPDALLTNNVIVICSPAGNSFAKYVFDKAANTPCMIRERFEDSPGKKRRSIVVGNRRFFADPVRGSGKRRDFLLVARYSNPWAAGKFIYVFAGCHAVGTRATPEFLRSAGYRRLSDMEEDDVVAIVPVSYSDYDLIDPTVDLGEPIIFGQARRARGPGDKLSDADRLQPRGRKRESRVSSWSRRARAGPSRSTG